MRLANFVPWLKHHHVIVITFYFSASDLNVACASYSNVGRVLLRRLMQSECDMSHYIWSETAFDVPSTETISDSGVTGSSLIMKARGYTPAIQTYVILISTTVDYYFNHQLSTSIPCIQVREWDWHISTHADPTSTHRAMSRMAHL